MSGLFGWAIVLLFLALIVALTGFRSVNRSAALSAYFIFGAFLGSGVFLLLVAFKVIPALAAG